MRPCLKLEANHLPFALENVSIRSEAVRAFLTCAGPRRDSASSRIIDPFYCHPEQTSDLTESIFVKGAEIGGTEADGVNFAFSLRLFQRSVAGTCAGATKETNFFKFLTGSNRVFIVETINIRGAKLPSLVSVIKVVKEIFPYCAINKYRNNTGW